jgi:hypothetical protein
MPRRGSNRKDGRTKERGWDLLGTRPFLFLPLFTNVLEGVFSEVQLITFNTKITHLGDAPAPLGRVGLRRRGGERTSGDGLPRGWPRPSYSLS